jgi:hypothetical protein
MWAYAYMKGWSSQDHIAFDFDDVHELPIDGRGVGPHDLPAPARTLRSGDPSDCPRRRVHEVAEEIRRLGDRPDAELDVPVVVVNLNGRRDCDEDRGPFR